MANDNNPGGVYYPPYFYPWYPGTPPEAAKNIPMPPPVMGYPPQMIPMYMPPQGYPHAPQMTSEAQQQFIAWQQAQHHLQQQAAQTAPGVDWNDKIQGVVEDMMGEQAGLLKNIINTIGVNDKEFWKGAMIGAAVTLLLTNDNVRNLLLQTACGAGDLLKTGGGKVKDTVLSGADTIKETASTSGNIVRDTLKAGKQGFRESVERHRQPGNSDS